MKLQIIISLVVSLTGSVFSNPILNPQNVLSSNKDDHPLLDKYIKEGMFSKDSVDENISYMWNLLEQNVDKQTIESYLKRYTTGQSFPKSSLPEKHDDEAYEYIHSSELEQYSLRIAKHPKSDPKSLKVDTVDQWTGYFDINEDDKHLFFWFFESRNNPAEDPIILWLNGGPGCSSMTGLFFELGPASINGTTLKPINNPYSWNSNASVIFLEQPVGVGYSYSDKSTVSSTTKAADDVYAFLQLFFAKFITFAKNDFHIAGESYAGHYIPNIASVIVNHEDRIFDLKSVLIGNGITDSLIQYKWYAPMACNATESGYKQLISDNECEDLDRMYPRCAALIQTCYNTQTALTCLPAYLYCERMMDPFEKTGLNYYDIRIPCDGDGCYREMDFVDDYLNLPEVMAALGVEVKSYTGCDNQVFRNFILSGDEPKPFHQFVAEILEHNVPVLIYAGDKDYICNWLGNRAWANALNWTHADSFQAAEVNNWYSNIDGKHAGTVQSNGLFTFLRIFDAGHMVPHDQPSNSLDMVNRWIAGDYRFSA